MWSRKTAGAAAAVVAMSSGVAACGVATDAQATPLSEDSGDCTRTRVIVYKDDFQTACWDDDDFPAQRVAEALSTSGAVSAGAVAYADAQELPDHAVFSSAGTPCLDVVAVSPSNERHEGQAAQRAAEALAAWDELPEENRCAGGAS